MTDLPPVGSRWDREGARVIVVGTLGDRVSVLLPRTEPVNPLTGRGPSRLEQVQVDDFLRRFTPVDETLEAKKLTTSALVFAMIDWKSLNPKSAVNLRARFEAARAELDARLPPRTA